MGQYDSSRTRVAPFFEALRLADPTGAAWLTPLLALPTHGSAAADRAVSPPLRKGEWYPREAKLPPPPVLLHWLVDHVAELALGTAPPTGVLAHRSRGEDDKRSRLLAGDPVAIREAHELLERRGSASAWYVLEGASRPDALLATDDAIVVVEGKRTEAGPTTSTTWLSGRHQMLRHLDAALELCTDNQRLLGFFLVQGEDAAPTQVPRAWQRAATDTMRPEVLATSLPHRREAERERIAQAFLGVATWQGACEALGVAYADLPTRVPATGSVSDASE